MELMERLPVLLIHGVAVRDSSRTSSPLWGRIPEGLREQGFSVWFGNQDAWGTVDANAKVLAAAIDDVLNRTGASQVHLVAHSKGGIDARRALHEPGVAGKVASVLTLSTPHKGLYFADRLAKSRFIVPKIVNPITNTMARRKGDMNPQGIKVLSNLTTRGTAHFNWEYEDIPGVLYRSYAFQTKPASPRFPDLAGMIIAHYDGENDGIVPLRATEQPHRMVVEVARGWRFEHDDAIDLRKKDIPLTLPDGTEFASIVDLVVWTEIMLDDHVRQMSLRC